DGKCFGTGNPTTEEVITTIAEASSRDVDLVVEATTRAFYNVWCHVDGREHGKLLNKLADLIEHDLDDLAALEALDNKKVLVSLKVAELCKEAGFPKGVINVLSDFGTTGTTMANHMNIDMITFTGKNC
ncbi:6153_t:CDS:2, partial [Racocetra fulgida]